MDIKWVEPPPPPPGEANGSANGHEPDPDGVVIEHAVRAVRKPRAFWDRIKLLVLIAVVWVALLWSSLSSDPLLSFHDAVITQLSHRWWLEALFGLEALRQLSYLLEEHSAPYHAFCQGVLAQSEARSMRLSDWTRYRIARIIRWVILILAVAVVAGAVMHENPAHALFELPGKAYHALPYVFQILLILLLAVGQFAAIFYFLSKGGVDVYFPDDVKTRFTDVWGQDAVLARVRESLVFMEDPASIESRGGYVPGGILLWGPPGTGKTLMAEAIAGETGKPFVFVDPGAFTNMFMGVGILKVKSLFRKLRRLAVRYGGVIVFFDEADSLGNRGLLSPGGIFGGGGANATPDSFGGLSPWAPSCHGTSYLSSHASSMFTNSYLGFGSHDHAHGSHFDANGGAPEGPRGIRDRMMGMGMMGGGGAGMGTLQALLTEMSGLKKPRGFMNRVVRRVLGMPPKDPPKYRIMIVMATNMPQALDEALLRPGRIDRIYKVGYPSKAGRVRTYKGYLAKVANNLTDEDVDKLATITPYATGATIKDMVNEALILAIGDGREHVTWADVLRAKQLKELGPPEDVEYIERERHAVAVHEACHAVVAYRVRHHLEIDLATIEKGSSYLGMVASIQPEDQFTSWRSEYESDVMVSLASLVGERAFFGGDSSSGVSGDLEAATYFASMMEGYWGMGSTIASHAITQRIGVGGGGGGGGGGNGRGQGKGGNNRRELLTGSLGGRIERKLSDLLERTEELLAENRREVLSVAHALETYKTLNGEDVVAVIEGTQGTIVDGRPYRSENFLPLAERYHERVVEAHRSHSHIEVPLITAEDWAPELVGAAAPTNGQLALSAAAAELPVANGTNGNGSNGSNGNGHWGVAPDN